MKAIARSEVLAGALLVIAGCAPFSRASAAFRDGDFRSAAEGFCEAADSESPSADEAQYFLARSLDEMGLQMVGISVRLRIAKAGSRHPYFRPALSELATLGASVDDVALLVRPLDAQYAPANDKALRSMDPAGLQSLHYLLAMYIATRGNVGEARTFLRTIKPGHPTYDRAQAMLNADDGTLLALATERKAATVPMWRARLDAELALASRTAPTDPCVKEVVDRAHRAFRDVLK